MEILVVGAIMRDLRLGMQEEKLGSRIKRSNFPTELSRYLSCDCKIVEDPQTVYIWHGGESSRGQ